MTRRTHINTPGQVWVTLSLVILITLALVAPNLASGAPVIPVEPEEHPIPAPSRVYFNVFGEGGGMCPGACGSGCPDSCTKEKFKRCHRERPDVVVAGDAYTCGISASCSELEDCQSGCTNPQLAANDALGLLFGIRPAHAPVIALPPGEQPDYEDAQCAQGCSNQAQNAGGIGMAGMQAVAGWALGTGPYDDAATWEYTTEEEGSELYIRCGPCEKCQDGGCVPDRVACPDGPPLPEPEQTLPAPISTGDVHMTSLDRLRFELQAVGEFVAFEDAAKDIVVQLRTKAWGKTVSVSSAIAMRVNGDIVGLYAEPSFRLLVNGSLVQLDEGSTLELSTGGEVNRFDSTYRISWPNGTIVVVRDNTRYFDIYAEAAEELREKLHGLVGNYNDNTSDDLTTRQGNTLPSEPSFEQLYDEFANSWRIQQAESLFVYAQGESTTTFTTRDFPEHQTRLSDLEPAAVEKAEQACTAVSHPRNYRDCILDVAVTGDASFAATHEGSGPPNAELAAGYLDGVAAGDIQLALQDDAAAGSEVAVAWSGNRVAGDFMAVARASDKPLQYLTYRVVNDGSEVQIPMPGEPGDYVVRYISGNGIAAESNIEVTPANATLQAAAEANSGADLTVTWEGPDSQQDYIAIATVDQRAGRQQSLTNTRYGSPLTVKVPDEPGQYELRYIQGQSRSILARQGLTVVGTKASLEATAQALSGSDLIVEWTGPDNEQDYISIAKAEQPGKRQQSYTPTRAGSPLTIQVPDEPGQYELRYIQGQSRNILTSQQLTILAAVATLDAQSETSAGSDLSVQWSGPDNGRDYIAIARPDQPDNRQETLTYTSKGKPLTIVAPEQPGDYELRYVQGQSRTVLTRQALTVTPD